MKEKLKVFGIEFLYLLAVIAIVAGVAWILFSDKYPFEIETPEAKTYSKLDRTKYQVISSGIEDAENKREIFTTSNSEMESIQEQIRVIPGKPNPFGSQNGESVLPTETVSRSTSTPTSTPTPTSTLTESGEEG